MIYRILKYLLPGIVLLSFLGGCERILKGPRQEETSTTQDKHKEGADPLGLSADFEIVPEKYQLAAVTDTSSGSGGGETEINVDSAASLAGMHETYRIQLFTSKIYGPAAREQKIAREVFDKDIFLDYEVPYYKVRIGDFATYDDAERYLPAAVEAGYKNAWVVKVTVNVRQLEQPYDENFPPLINRSDTGAIVPEQINEKPEYPEN
jgi:hypothetical protein